MAALAACADDCRTVSCTLPQTAYIQKVACACPRPAPSRVCTETLAAHPELLDLKCVAAPSCLHLVQEAF